MAVVAVLMGALAFSFFRAQVLASSTYVLRAESNRLRPLPVPAPRGTIYDRQGRIIADNVPTFSVSLLPDSRDSVRVRLQRIRPFLEISDARIEELLEARDRNPNQLLTVELDADFDAVSALEERRHLFPQVHVEMRPRRRYAGGAAMGHVMGYIGEVTEAELESEAFSDEIYEPGSIVGKTGIERQYESRLQGRRGVRYVEVDARGRIVGDFAGVTRKQAVPGSDLHLNIDLELQEWIHEIFPDTLKGAVVALDASDGGVLALYSAPGYDPNDFVGGIDRATWEALQGSEDEPLFNRAVLGRYAPASTWKLATAAIALDLGLVTPGQTMPDPCTGSWTFGNRTWRCWKREGHGDVDLTEAVQHSCDVYFYQLGLLIGLDRLLERSTDIGFSRRCGIDLPEEAKGVFPASRQFWVDTPWFGYEPQEGEVLSLAIGQGPNDQTPLKMAQFYVALARNGSAPAPLLARESGRDVPEGWQLDLSEEHLESLREGLRRVTAPEGTAYLASLEHWDLLGKTGTGQNNLSVRGLAEDHAWFAALAGPPGEPPEISVVVLVEYGGSGSAVAAPIASKAADFYLRRKYGIPVDTIQTLGEHLRTRGWPAWANPDTDGESRDGGRP